MASPNRVITILTVLWGLFVVYATTIPFDIDAGLEALGESWRLVLEDPFQGRSKADIVSNVLLFIPWGILFGLRHGLRGRSALLALVWAGFSAMLLSSFVEIIQLAAPSRTTSLLDLITNVFGSLCGAAAGWWFLRQLWPQVEPHFEHYLARRPLTCLAVVIVVLAFVLEMDPYDFSLDMGSLKTAAREAVLVPFGASYGGEALAHEPSDLLADFLAWILLGGVLAVAARENGRKGLEGVALASVLGFLVAGLIETAQLAVMGRRTSATTVLIAGAGAMLGALLVDSQRRRDPRAWLGAALGIWLVSLALASWSPIDLDGPFLAIPDEWSWNWLVPFLPYYQKTSMKALGDVLRETGAFLPVGALLAARYSRISLGGVVGRGFLYGAILELVQIFHAQRTADITDVFSSAVGAGLGAFLWRWGRARWKQLARDPGPTRREPPPPAEDPKRRNHPGGRSFGFRDP